MIKKWLKQLKSVLKIFNIVNIIKKNNKYHVV